MPELGNVRVAGGTCFQKCSLSIQRESTVIIGEVKEDKSTQFCVTIDWELCGDADLTYALAMVATVYETESQKDTFTSRYGIEGMTHVQVQQTFGVQIVF